MKNNLEFPMKINTDAIFLSDAHENTNKTHFLEFLEALDDGRISMPSQLFLLGDMFDVLVGVGEFANFFARQIELINKLALKTEIIYFEGNHDFYLKDIFKNVKIVPTQAQPLNLEFAGKSVQIAHGDIFLPPLTQRALALLRKPFLLGILDFFDKLCARKLSKSILRSQMHKKLDFKIDNFKEKIEQRMANFSADIIIEGHWHQGVSFEVKNKFYINLPSFACKRSFFMLEYRDYKIQILKRSLNV